MPAVHFEAKRCERLSLYTALAQARRDAGDKLPVVAHRRSNCEWLAIMPLVDLLAILRDSDFVPTAKPEGGIPDDELYDEVLS